MKKLGILLLIAVFFAACEKNVEELNQDNLVLKKGKVAGPNSVFSLDFSNPNDATDNTSIMAGWVVDRKAPETFKSVMLDGDDRLEINIDESGPTSGFYGYQGKKYQDAGGAYWNAEANARFSYSFYIDPDWEDDDGEKQQTGVWPVLGNSIGKISAYPILAYEDSDANENGEAGFKAYVYNSDFTDAWVSIGLPKQLKIDPQEGGWVHIEAQLHKTEEGAALKWRINNKLVLDERGYNVFAPSVQFLEFIFNSVNYGVDQDYYYDDIILTNPGFAGN